MKKLILVMFLLGWTGSWQLQSSHPALAANITVTTTTDELNTDGDCSLREALQAANNNVVVDACLAGEASVKDTITLATGENYILSITGQGEEANATGDLDILDNPNAPIDLEIVDPGGLANINANGIDRVLDAHGSSTLLLTGIGITNGVGAFQGGGIQGATLVLSNVRVTSNSAEYGGGIFGGNVTLTNGTIIGGVGSAKNSATIGGGIRASQLTLNNSKVIGNTAYTAGGIYCYYPSPINYIKLENGSKIGEAGVGNSATQSGGIYAGGCPVTIDNSSISANIATSGSGGGLTLGPGSSLTVQNGSVIGGAGAGNSALNGSGGGINLEGYSGTQSVTITDSTVSYNSALYGGGLWLANNGSHTISASTITSNTATDKGGGIFLQATLTINNNSYVANNQAVQGGAVYIDSNTAQGHIIIDGSRIINNMASNNGGAVYSPKTFPDTLDITNSCLVDNTPTALVSLSATVQTATSNWWGATDGPGPVGLGSGDTVGSNIDFSGFLTTSILGCPFRTIPSATATPTNTPTNTPTFTPTYTPSQTPTPCILTVPAPTLIAPAHRAHVTTIVPTFSWSSVNGAQSYRFMIYLEDRSFEFKKRVFNTTYTTQTPLVVNKYLWRVRSQELICGNWSGWSTRNTLFVD